MQGFHQIHPDELENICRLFSKDWALITAGNEQTVNTMVGGWGYAGYMWKKPVISCMIRPQRHTYHIVEENDRLSLCFLPDGYREALQLCGKESGRDMDKFAAAGLTPAFREGVPYVAESRLVVFCRKIYVDDLKKECFVDKEPLRYYEAGDFHRVYTCEVESIFVRD